MVISEFLNGNDSRSGRVTLECFLVANKTEAYLVDSLDALGLSNKETYVDVSSFDIYGRFNGYVAPYVGGEWFYADTCIAELEYEKSYEEIFIAKIISFSIVRDGVEYSINFNNNNFRSEINVNKLLDKNCLGYNRSVDVIGFFTVKDGLVIIADNNDEGTPINDVIHVSIPDIENIVDWNFIADDDWPDYHVLVRLKGTLEYKDGDILELTSISQWELIYDQVIIKFSNRGKLDAFT